MSQGKRVIKELSDNERSNNGSQQIQSNKIAAVKKTAKKRGRINVNACYRCRRDKKKCDGNYSTKETCRYCRHHKVECSYPEPGRKRIKIVQPHKDFKIKVKETKNFKKSGTKKDPIKDINDRIIKVEANLSDVTELLASNVRHHPDIKEITQQLFFRLLFDESTTIEQTQLLRRLWILLEKIMNYSACNEECLYAFYGRIQYLESDQEEVRSLMWKEIQNFVDRCNDAGNVCENESSVHPLTPTLSSEVLSIYTAPSFSPIPSEFDSNNNNNDYYEEVSLENICHSTLNVPKTTINDSFNIQTTYDNKPKSSPIVPSQRIPCARSNNRQKDYQGEETSLSVSPNEYAWTRNQRNDPLTFNNHFTTNLMPYVDSNSSHNNTPIIDNETDYLQHLTNEGTNFLCFQSTMSSPLFQSENCTTPTFNNLQSSPPLHPLNEIDHLYGILSPTNEYVQEIDDKIGLETIEEQYSSTSNF